MFSLHGTCPACRIGLPDPDPRLFSFNSRQGACRTCGGLGSVGGDQDDRQTTAAVVGVCPACGGSRLNADALSVRIGGRTIWDYTCQPADRMLGMLSEVVFEPHEAAVAGPVVAEIKSRLAMLIRLGLSYLGLGRSGDTLSGGEGQRVRLAAQLGSNLTGVCYILDEPTIGLHPRDNRLLIDALHELRDRGNTVLVVEHDDETIRAADHIIDLGPGAGRQGGEVVVTGGLRAVLQTAGSITGTYLRGGRDAEATPRRPYRDLPALTIRGAEGNNLQDITVDFPLGSLICVTGVSGSGKSTLLKETLFKGLARRLKGRPLPQGCCRDISGWERIGRVLEVDHSPIGRTPRSVPATYVGIFNDIRSLFARTPAARARGYRAARFSFNVAGGRCEACKGQGRPKVSMNFLPDVYVPCETCGGRRFNEDTLAIRYRGKSIADVLEMTFEEAAELFDHFAGLKRALGVVCDIGLGYLRLGQPSPTLSGGEAQRIKLAEQLARPAGRHTFFVLDEPTTGLHMADARRLLGVLQALVDQGNTVALIEHNMEMIAAAYYIVDMGPEGGEQGGRVVAAGSPEEIAQTPRHSHTARFLAARGGPAPPVN